MAMNVEEYLRQNWNSSDTIIRVQKLSEMGFTPKEVDLDTIKKDYDDLPEPWKCFMLDFMHKK